MYDSLMNAVSGVQQINRNTIGSLNTLDGLGVVTIDGEPPVFPYRPQNRWLWKFIHAVKSSACL